MPDGDGEFFMCADMHLLMAAVIILTCNMFSAQQKVVPLTVKNSGVTTVYLNFSASDLVKNIFTVRDSHGIVIKAIEQHTLRPGMKVVEG